MKVQYKKIIASILFVLISFITIAQTPPTPEQRDTLVPPGSPIDEGIYILLAIGLVYGIVKIIQANKAKTA
ncbi:MAG: PID-CTERM protein-sorting domain-containing protein [Oceanihabitans sp.]